MNNGQGIGDGGRVLRRMMAGVGLAVVAVASAGLRGVGAQQDDAAQPAYYTSRVQPIFQTNCYRCHGGMNHRGGLSMETRAGMMKGGHDGTVVVPGDPGKSLLLQLMRHEGPAKDPMPMPPPPRPKLSDTDLGTVERWIKAGAVMPPDVPKP